MTTQQRSDILECVRVLTAARECHITEADLSEAIVIGQTTPWEQLINLHVVPA